MNKCSVVNDQTSWHHVTEDHNLKIHHGIQNLKSERYIVTNHQKFLIKISTDSVKQNMPYINSYVIHHLQNPNLGRSITF